MRIQLPSLRTCLIVACLAGGLSAHAQTISNPSFELPSLGSGYRDGSPNFFNEYVPNGGNGSVGVQTFSTGGLTMGTAAGNQSLYINPGGATGRGVYQDLGALQANTTYLLTFAATAGTYQADITSSIIANASFYNGSAPSNNPLATTAITLITANHTFTDYTLTYTTGATVSGDLTLLLSETSTIGQSNFDNLRLSAVAAVPEASTWMMMGTFLGMLGLSRYRRKARV